MSIDDTDETSPTISPWKRHRRKVGWVILTFLICVCLLMHQRGSYAKERTWELAARLGLSTDWKQWYSHEYYPEPEDNVACHPLFAALQAPGGRNPQFHFSPLEAEAKSALPAGVIVAELPNGVPVGFTEFLNLLKDEATHPLPPSDIISATKGMERITEQVLDADKRKGRNWRMANPADYSDPYSLPITAISNTFETTKRLTTLWKARTAAFLTQGDRVSAQREMQALLAWGTFWDGRESVVSALVNVAIEGIVQNQLEPLLMHPLWQTEELASFDTSLARRDSLRSTFFALRREACGLVLTEDNLYNSLALSSGSSASWLSRENFLNFSIRYAPASVRYQNALVMSDYMAQHIGAHYDSATGLARPAPWARSGSPPSPPTSIGLNNFIAAIAIPALSNVFESSTRLQTNYNHDRVLIALRKYFLTKGAYPEKLQQIPADLPIDRVTGEPIHYHLAADGSKLRLWSANRSGKPGNDALPPKDPASEGWIGLEIGIRQ